MVSLRFLVLCLFFATGQILFCGDGIAEVIDARPETEGLEYQFASLRSKSKPKNALPVLLREPSTHERVKSIIPHAKDNVVIISDRQERTPDGLYIAEGNVDITYLDMQMQADYATYDINTQTAHAKGNCIFIQEAQYFRASEAEYNLNTKRGTFYDVDGYTDKEFLVKAKRIDKTGEEKYDVQRGFLTACREATPFWSITSSRSRITVNKRALLKNAIFRVKNAPLFYSPFLIIPLEKRERQSGFIVPSLGSSTSNGKFFHSAFYLTLGESADATLVGDYFSRRGPGYGLKFRARPSETAFVDLSSYTVNDRLGAGGTDIFINGVAPLKYGFRAVAGLNYVTNFRFRQVFSDTFRSATNTFENSNVFAIKNFDAFSTKVFFTRQVTFFPTRPFVVHNGPSFSFNSLGKQIGSVGSHALRFYMDSSVENLTRRDGVSSIELGRFDIFPRMSLPFHTFAGITLTPTIGLRETLYTDSLAKGSLTDTTGKNLNRHYVAFELSARMPGFYKVFHDQNGKGSLKHTVEPEVTYRRYSGIRDFDRIVRFDDKDVLANTNEVEYALVNRFFVKRSNAWNDASRTHELLVFKVSQKYYFDPTFGNILVPDQPNIFLPANAFSGYPFFSDGRRHISPLNALVRVNPTPGASIDFRTDYDPYWKQWRDASLSGAYRVEKVYLAGTYLVTKSVAAEPSTFKSNQLQSQIGYGNPLKGFAAGVIISYDVARSLLLYSGWRFHLNADCCGTTFEVRQFNLGFRNETQLRFSFILKGLGHFGNLRHPESLF